MKNDFSSPQTPPPSDLQPTLDIRPTLDTKPTPNVISSTHRTQLEVLRVLEPGGLDFQTLSSISWW